MKVYIDKENLLNEYRSHLDKHVDRFKVTGVAGLTLNGGMSRGYADHLSEVDITVYLTQKGHQAYLKGELTLPEGICKIDDMLYDVKIVNFDSEKNRDHAIDTELWDMQYAEILYDPYSKIKQLFKEKLHKKVHVNMASGHMFHAWWHFRLAGDIWLYREDVTQGHMMLNEAAKALLKVLYVINRVYIPHDKWLAHFTQSLDWLPEERDQLLTGLFATGDFTLESVRKRQAYMESVYQAINDRVGYDLTQVGMKNDLVKILEKSEYSVEIFDKTFGLKKLYTDPYRHFISIESDKVYIHLSKLKALTPDSMYEWHYNVVESVLASL